MKNKKPQQEKPYENQHILPVYEGLLDTLYELSKNVEADEKQDMKTAQAIAAIALADQFLSQMPVEMAWQYRQLAKRFCQQMDLDD